MNLKQIELKLNTLTIFSNLYDSEVIKSLNELLSYDEDDEESYIVMYCEFVTELYRVNPNFSSFIYDFIMNDENLYVLKKSENKKINKVLDETLANELDFLEKLISLTSNDLLKDLSIDIELPKFENKRYHLKEDYYKRIEELPKKGYGVYAKYHVFGVEKEGLYPIKHPDTQRLSELTGYERERNLVIKNTLAFLKGMKANNALLYGDAGTGKSSAIKAICNEYKDEGLRLIEVKKHQISLLPDVIEELSTNPLKFIIFIDDLSFSSNDDNFIALKNILEGGTATNRKNIIVYATSNRRHLIKENMSDRSGGELFKNDSMQETMSLAARFGLTITYSRPEKKLFLDIVKNLAKEYKLNIPEDELCVKAEAFAIRNNGRSPRTAKQFIEYEKINSTIK